ncbi:hypothetical protein NEOC95_002278 [Neochlamydia sp. AcF95]|nr:hypothetical protein [Neochlamydia sp. AcF95]
MEDLFSTNLADLYSPHKKMLIQLIKVMLFKGKNFTLWRRKE